MAGPDYSLFINQFETSTKELVDTLLTTANIGKTYPKAKFKMPTPANTQLIRVFIATLVKYDTDPTNTDVLDRLKSLMDSLEITAIRVKESPNNCLVFYPINKGKVKDVIQPFKFGAVITLRFGTHLEKNSNPTIVFDPHSYQDGTQNSIVAQFFGGAKWVISNAFNPNTASNENFNPKGRKMGGNIKRYTDPSHSNATAFKPISETLYAQYANACGTITHGMGKPKGNRAIDLLMGNDFNARFLKDPVKPSYDTLLAISLGISPTLQPHTIYVASPLPGFVVHNGKKVLLTSTTDPNSVFIQAKSYLNTDAIGRAFEGGFNSFSKTGLKQGDRLMHCEFGPDFRRTGSRLMDIFVAAQESAEQMFSVYDPEIHDPWKLAERFPDIYNDMTLYPTLFDPQFIARYKKLQTNPFVTTNASEAVANATSLASAMDQEVTPITDDQDIDKVVISTAIAPVTGIENTEVIYDSDDDSLLADDELLNDDENENDTSLTETVATPVLFSSAATGVAAPTATNNAVTTKVTAPVPHPA